MTWRERLRRAWHWANLVLAMIGAALCARLSLVAFDTAEVQSADLEWTWYGLGIVLAAACLWLIVECFRRLRALGLIGRRP